MPFTIYCLLLEYSPPESVDMQALWNIADSAFGILRGALSARLGIKGELGKFVLIMTARKRHVGWGVSARKAHNTH
jgi:hypothetical protein